MISPINLYNHFLLQTSVGSPAQRKSTSSSVSSFEFDPRSAPAETDFESEGITNECNNETGARTDEKLKNNRTLIIGGKEYDGVGKDTKSKNIDIV